MILSTNPLSPLWRGPRCTRWQVDAYIAGMVSYSASLISRVCFAVLKTLLVLGQLIRAVAKPWHLDSWKNLGTSVVVFAGAVDEIVNAVFGVICPPLGYKLDEWLYRDPIIQEGALVTEWRELTSSERRQLRELGHAIDEHDNVVRTQRALGHIVRDVQRSRGNVVSEQHSIEQALRALKTHLQKHPGNTTYEDMQAMTATSLIGRAIILKLLEDQMLETVLTRFKIKSDVQTSYCKFKKIHKDRTFAYCIQYWIQESEETKPDFIRAVEQVEGKLSFDVRQPWFQLWQAAFLKVCGD